MERLTERDEIGNVIRGDSIFSDWGVPEGFRGEAINRLAAYEDTGLEPEEIKAFVSADEFYKTREKAEKALKGVSEDD